MEFYSFKHRRTIEVPPNALRKRRIMPAAGSGTRGERYSVVAEVTVDGTPVKVSRFVKREAFDALDVPEVT